MASVSTPAILALLAILSVSIGQLAIATIVPDELTFTVNMPESTIAQAPTGGDAGAPAPAPGAGGYNSVSHNTLENSLAVKTPVDEKKDARYLETNMAFAANKLELFNKNVLEAKLNSPTTDDETKSCLSVCADVYSSAVDSLQKGVEDMKTPDFPKANFDMSAFVNDVETCSECAKKLDDPELEKFEVWLKGISDDCFDKIAKYSTFSINNLE